MADKKITNLNLHTDLQPEDLLIVVDNPNGIPVNKKISVETFFASLAANDVSVQSFSKVNVDRTINGLGDLDLVNYPVIYQPRPMLVVGTNDLNSTGVYSGSAQEVTFYVQIVGAATGTQGQYTADEYVWYIEGGSPSAAITIDFTTYQTLQDGVSVKFDSLVGHQVGDTWAIHIRRPGRINFGSDILLEDGGGSLNQSNAGNLLLEDSSDLALEQDLYITANTDTIQIVGDCSIGTGTNKIGFFGTAPVTQNTSMTSVTTVAELRDELIRLGLIA